jgi:hypothetical protein
MHGIWAIGDHIQRPWQRVRWRSGNQVPISYGEMSRPHPCAQKCVHEFKMGLRDEWTDTGAKVTNVSRGFALSLPGGGFEPKTFVS